MQNLFESSEIKFLTRGTLECLSSQVLIVDDVDECIIPYHAQTQAFRLALDQPTMWALCYTGRGP